MEMTTVSFIKEYLSTLRSHWSKFSNDASHNQNDGGMHILNSDAPTLSIYEIVDHLSPTSATSEMNHTSSSTTLSKIRQSTNKRLNSIESAIHPEYDYNNKRSDNVRMDHIRRKRKMKFNSSSSLKNSTWNDSTNNTHSAEVLKFNDSVGGNEYLYMRKSYPVVYKFLTKKLINHSDSQWFHLPEIKGQIKFFMKKFLLISLIQDSDMAHDEKLPSHLFVETNPYSRHSTTKTLVNKEYIRIKLMLYFFLFLNRKVTKIIQEVGNNEYMPYLFTSVGSSFSIESVHSLKKLLILEFLTQKSSRYVHTQMKILLFQHNRDLFGEIRSKLPGGTFQFMKLFHIFQERRNLLNSEFYLTSKDDSNIEHLHQRETTNESTMKHDLNDTYSSGDIVRREAASSLTIDNTTNNIFDNMINDSIKLSYFKIFQNGIQEQVLRYEMKLRKKWSAQAKITRWVKRHLQYQVDSVLIY